ncbi:MAG: type II secretion system protein N [Pseudomonadales bacterium]
MALSVLSLPSGLQPYRRFSIPIIVFFLLLLILSMPARVLLSFVDITQFGIYAQGVSGPWYAASSQRVRVQTPSLAVDLTNLKWRVKPLASLRGRFMLALDAEFAQRPVQAVVGISVGGRVFVQHLHAAVPMQEFAPLMTRLTFPIDGQINLQDVSLELHQQWPVELRGKVLLTEVTLTLPIQLLDVGDVLLGLGMQDKDAVVAVIENDGQLGLGGQLTLAANHRFGLLLTSTPSAQMSRELRVQMQAMLGNPDKGKFSLRYDGAW